jgi:hypothetical protein
MKSKNFGVQICCIIILGQDLDFDYADFKSWIRGRTTVVRAAIALVVYFTTVHFILFL